MDKNKIIQTATKYMQRGQYDRAIAEYRKILKVDPHDVRVLLKIGEIQQKKGENIVAATTLFDVAKAYASDGFFLKAVAVYKQVLKLDPSRVDVSLLLAELYQQLGLLSDAMSQLQSASAHFESKGETAKVLEVARKMLSVEPSDLGARIRVADLLQRQGETTAALEELGQALSSLKGDEAGDDFLKIGERIVSLNPADGDLGRKLAAAWLQRGDTRRALSRLQVCFQQDPRHPETLSLLGRAFSDLSQTAKAVSVYKELAKVHRDEGRRSDEMAAWRRIAELAPDDLDAAAALSGRTPVGRQAAGQAPTGDLLQTVSPGPLAGGQPPPLPASGRTPPPFPAASAAKAPGSQGAKGGDDLTRLLTETDVFVKYGLVQKAVDHLDKIFAIDPESIPAHERAVEIQRGRHPAALAASLAALARLHARDGHFDQGRPHYEEFLQVAPGHPEAAALGSLYANVEASIVVEESVVIEESVALPLDIEVAGPEPLILGPADGALPADEPLILGPVDGSLPADEALILGPADGALPADEPLAVEPMFAPDEPLLVPLDIDDEEQPVVLGEGWDEPLDPVWLETSDDEALLDLAAEAIGDEVVDPSLDGQGDDWIPSAPEPQPPAEAQAAFTPVDTDATRPAPAPDDPTLAAPPPAEFDRTRTLAPEQLLQLQALEGNDATVELEPFDASVEIDASTLEDASAELAEAAALVQTGHFDEAATIYRSILDRWPDHPDATARLGVLQAWLNVGQRRSDVPIDPPVEEPVDEILPPDPDAGWEPVELEGATAFESPAWSPAPSETGRVATAPQEDEAIWKAPDPTDWASAGPHSTAGWMPDESAPFEFGDGVGSGAAFDEEGLFDLGAVLAEELAEEEASGGPTAGDGFGDGGFQYPADEVLSKFKEGVAQVVKPEDVVTHYNLAIAYREMGLFDDAIEAFEMARSGCVGEEKEAECVLMIGLCHRARGDESRALEAFREGLRLVTSPDVEKGLLFEIAQSLEATGDSNEALVTYGKVARMDGSFRNVKQEIARLVAGGAAVPGRVPTGTV